MLNERSRSSGADSLEEVNLQIAGIETPADALIRETLQARRGELESYIHGTLPPEARQALIQEMEENRLLRLASISLRYQIPAEEQKASKAAAGALQYGLGQALSYSSKLPGDPYSAGLELSESTSNMRGYFSGNANRFYRSLVELQEFEDIALENLFRLEENHLRGKRALTLFKPQTLDDPVLVAVGLREPKNRPGLPPLSELYYEYVHFSSAKAAEVPDSFDAAQSSISEALRARAASQ